MRQLLADLFRWVGAALIYLSLVLEGYSNDQILKGAMAAQKALDVAAAEESE